MDITHSPEWQALLAHREQVKHRHLRDFFAADPERFSHLALRHNDFLADFSKQRVSQETVALLVALARAAEVESWRDRLFAGEAINFSEHRAVLHPALRIPGPGPFPTATDNVMPQVRQVRQHMRDFSERVRSGLWRGFSGDAIRNVVNLGIGGSDLGPKMAAKALSAYEHPGLHVHFVSNLDGAQLAPLLETLDPRSTLFIVASKTFTTQETLRNAQTAREWLLASAGEENREAVIARHFVGVTAATEEAGRFGIPQENLFAMWDWVGGRYSLWSAVGLALVLTIGMTQFERLLTGAQAMDKHFLETPLERNLPVLMGLLGIWNTNFLGAETLAILPYNESLRALPAYLQQLEMESNGKTISRTGSPLGCQPNPIVWGEIGINGQHAFFQLLHQGGWLIPSDFIISATSDYPLPGHNGPLLANCLAQGAALAFGRTEGEARADLEGEGRQGTEIQALLPYKVFAGNQPSTTLVLPRLDPYHLGLLLALYEHKVFVQGVVWGINSFDQWGVELGKKLARRLQPALEGHPDDSLDASTRGLIAYCRRYGQL